MYLRNLVARAWSGGCCFCLWTSDLTLKVQAGCALMDTFAGGRAGLQSETFWIQILQLYTSWANIQFGFGRLQSFAKNGTVDLNLCVSSHLSSSCHLHLPGNFLTAPPGLWSSVSSILFFKLRLCSVIFWTVPPPPPHPTPPI